MLYSLTNKVVRFYINIVNKNETNMKSLHMKKRKSLKNYEKFGSSEKSRILEDYVSNTRNLKIY